MGIFDELQGAEVQGSRLSASQVPGDVKNFEDKLTPRQRRFVAEYALSGNASEAARLAGYSANGAKVTGCRLLTNPNLQTAISDARHEYSALLGLRKEHIIAAMLSAVDTARVQGNPAAMISGLREIGRLCGFYEAEVRGVQLTENQQRLQKQFEAMSDEELYQIARSGQELVNNA